jgi:hypothetical protein
MSPAPDLNRLAVGERLQGPLLLLAVDHRNTSGGPFTMLTLGNCHRQLLTGNGLVSARSLWQLDQRRAYRGSSDWGAEPMG